MNDRRFAVSLRKQGLSYRAISKILIGRDDHGCAAYRLIHSRRRWLDVEEAA
jgi:hypothetical protein